MALGLGDCTYHHDDAHHSNKDPDVENAVVHPALVGKVLIDGLPELAQVRGTGAVVGRFQVRGDDAGTEGEPSCNSQPAGHCSSGAVPMDMWARWLIERLPAMLPGRGKDTANGLVARPMSVGLIIGGLGCVLIGVGYLALSTSNDTSGLVFAGLLVMYGIGQASVGFVLRYRGRIPPRSR